MTTIERLEAPLDLTTIDEILERASILDGDEHRESLAEQARFALEASEGVVHFLERSSGELVGYAQLILDPAESVIEFLGNAPSKALRDATIKEAGERGLRPAVWFHGCSDPSEVWLKGYAIDREVLRLERPLGVVEAPEPPVDVTLRTFIVGLDEEHWLDTNASAFRSHPNQGSWGRAELEQRIAEPWFDPQGFIVMEIDHAMCGFCWTKVHRDAWGAGGEIYVIGIVPAVSGRKLGRLLVLAGLAHLSSRDVAYALLYVEADNTPARRLYEELGFTQRWSDLRLVPES